MKYFRVTFNRNLTWSNRVENLIKKINQRIGLLRRVKHLIPQKECITLYNTLILPLMDYGNLIGEIKITSPSWILFKYVKIKLPRLYFVYHLTRPPQRLNRCIYMCINISITSSTSIFSYNWMQTCMTTTLVDVKIFTYHARVKRKWGKQRFTYHALQDWNSFNQHIKESTSLSLFKNNLNNSSWF